MTKTWFDQKLFRDGFRQLTLAGLICALILALQAVLIPVGQVLQYRSEGAAWMGREVVGFWAANPLVVTTFCLITPLMALWLFRFLSRRDACDFYHAIPQSRTCLYISFLAAVLAWALILQWGSSLLAILAHMVFPKYFEVQVREILVANVQVTACNLFVLGAVLLAVTLTGNALTNLVVSLLIIFFPRLLMFVIRACVGDSLSIIGSEYLSFLGNNWNVVTGTIFFLLDDGYSLMKNLTAGAYTAAFGILYLVIGGIMFNRRRSEAAGEAAIHPALQLIFRLIPACVFCLIPSVQIFYMLVEHRDVAAIDLYNIVVLYLIGIFIYFLYELISTRKVRNLPKAVPGLLFLLAFNLLIIFGMFSMRRSLLQYSPEADEIDSVRIIGSNVYVRSMRDEDSGVIPGYFSSRRGQIELTDPKVKELVAQRLKESIEFDEHPEQRKDSDYDYQSQEVAITVNGKTTYRVLHLLMTDVTLLADTLYQDDSVADIYMNLPAADDPAVSLTLENNMPSAEETRQKNASEVWEALREDVQDMGLAAWYTYCSDPSRSGAFTLYMRYKGTDKTTGLAVVISQETPKALNAALKYAWQESADARAEMEQQLDQLAEDLEQNQDGISYNFTSMEWINTGAENSAKGDLYASIENVTPEQVRALSDLLKQQDTFTGDNGNGYLAVMINVEYSNGALEENYTQDRDLYDSYYGSMLLIAPEDMQPYIDLFRIGEVQY